VSVITNLLGSIPAVIGGAEDTIEGTDASEVVLGTDNDDVIHGLGGDDFIQGLAGSDQIDAGDGNDTVLGGEGDDTIDGGAGDDVLRGDAGADTFLFDVSQEGADTIVDPEPDDVLAFSAQGLLAAGLTDFSGAALDEAEGFAIVANDDGDTEIQTPGGTITLNGIALPEGLTFAQLESDGNLVLPELIQGTDEGEDLTGTDGDDAINALGGDDTISGLSGDDVIVTGAGRDDVNIDPSNPDEGADTITDFTAPSAADPTAGDFLAFQLADILAADPDLPAADGTDTSLSLADFDASENWTLGAADDGNLLFTHPGGSVEFSDIAFNGQQFANLGTVIKVDGAEIPAEGVPVEPPSDGEASGGGDDQGATDGEQQTADASQVHEEAIA
jgi:Ca2+-binding RTX toxin-like protein